MHCQRPNRQDSDKKVFFWKPSLMNRIGKVERQRLRKEKRKRKRESWVWDQDKIERVK